MQEEPSFRTPTWGNDRNNLKNIKTYELSLLWYAFMTQIKSLCDTHIYNDQDHYQMHIEGLKLLRWHIHTEESRVLCNT